MKKCIQGVTPEWFELDGQEGEADKTAFYLVPLDGFGRSDISMLSMSSRSGGDNAAVYASAEVMKLAFKLGVKDWRNIEDPDAEPDPKRPEKTPLLRFSLANMKRMDPAWIIEVGARVLKISDLGAEERKNSNSPSS